jgi:1-acyl-sn-glycerol-3-phosphate acyltransferase
MKSKFEHLLWSLTYGFRLFKLAFAFIFFGLGSLLLIFGYLPFLRLTIQQFKQRAVRVRQSVQFCWQLLIKYCCWSGLMSLEVKNQELINSVSASGKGFVVVANHPSLFDVVILISLLPQSNCIVKDALKKNFFMRDVVSSCFIFNSSNLDELMENCSESLNRGDNLLIFPEGTRTNPNQKSKLSRGASQIALHCNANILPIRIQCEPAVLMKGQRWYNLPHQKVTYTLEVMQPISTSEYIQESKSRKVAASLLTERIGEILNLS